MSAMVRSGVCKTVKVNLINFMQNYCIQASKSHITGVNIEAYGLFLLETISQQDNQLTSYRARGTTPSASFSIWCTSVVGSSDLEAYAAGIPLIIVPILY